MIRQYFVAVVLPEQLNKKILEYIQMMQDKYGCRVGLRSPAHITLVPPFWMNEEKESMLSEVLKPLAAENSFELATDNFSSFPPKTIFISLKKNFLLDELKEKTTSLLLQHQICSASPETRPFVPHITIATRDLHKKSYNEAWDYFKERKFDALWTVSSICILKHNGSMWKVLNQVKFGEGFS
jgi:2'-5' RNA ligase